MNASEPKRLKHLEVENAKLKKMLADRLLEIDVLKEINARKVHAMLSGWPWMSRCEHSRQGAVGRGTREASAVGSL